MTFNCETASFWKKCSCIFLAFFCAGGWSILSVFTSIGSSNVVAYVVGLFVFIVVLWILQWLVPEKLFSALGQATASKTFFILKAVSLFLFVMIVLAAFLQVTVISGGQSAMQWAIKPHSIVTFFLVCSAVLLFARKRRAGTTFSHKVLSVLWCVVIVGLLVFSAWWAYVPNSLSYTWDYEAYWFSAFAAARGIPLSVETASYYGHYGMLLAPVFKLLGGFTPARVAFVLSAQAVIITAASCYVLHHITKSFFWRFLGVFAMLDYYATLSTVEGQMTPHRVLFPVILMAFALFYLKNLARYGKRFQIAGMIAGYSLAILGLIWSTDSGIVGILAWCALHCYLLFSTHRVSMLDFLKVIKVIVAGILCVVLAWQLTSAMNMLVWKGDAIDFQTFITPLSIANFTVAKKEAVDNDVAIVAIEKSENANVPNSTQTSPPEMDEAQKPDDVSLKSGAGYIGNLQLELVRKWTPWGLALVLFLFFVAQGLLNLSFFTRQPKFCWQNGFALFTGVLGIFMLIYFFNRVYYYNMFTTWFFIVILLVLAASKASAAWDSGEKTPQNAVCGSIATVMALCLILFGSFAIGRMPVQAAKIMACQKNAVMSVFFDELHARISTYENVYIIGSSATYFNAALQQSNEQIMWRPWVNELHLPPYPAQATIIVADEVYWNILKNQPHFTQLTTEYSLAASFTLNYNNVGYEESETFYVYTSKHT